MEDWGSKLKKIRESKQLTLSDIEKETNINMRILTKIEEGLFDKLPKGIFARNFVRQYCEFIGVNSDEVIKDVFKEEDVVDFSIEDDLGNGTASKKKFGFFALATVVIVILSWLLFGHYLKKESPQVDGGEKTISKTINTQSNGSLSKKDNSPSMSELNSKNINNIEGNEEKNKIVANDDNGNEKKITHNLKKNPKSELKPGKLQIVADGDCWIHFKCNSLEKDFIIKSGESLSFSCNGLITFDLGNALVVSLSYNEIPIPLPADKKVIKNFSINLDELKEKPE